MSEREDELRECGFDDIVRDLMYSESEIESLKDELIVALRNGNDEIARLRARVEKLESYRRTPDEMRAALVREEQSHLETLHELDEKSARIRELESALAGHAKIDHCHGDDDGVPCVSHLAYLDVTNNEGGVWITTEQIDAAVGHIVIMSASSRGSAWTILNYFGVFRCPSTGCYYGVYTEGNDDGSMTTDYPCQCCSGWGSKGWVIEEVE